MNNLISGGMDHDREHQRLRTVSAAHGKAFPASAPYAGFTFTRDDQGITYFAPVAGVLSATQWRPVGMNNESTIRKYNYLINGDFQVNQRRPGVSTVCGPGFSKYVTDKWIGYAPTGVTLTITPQPSGTPFIAGSADYTQNFDEEGYLALTAPANVVSGGTNISNFIPRLKQLAGKTVTFSGWFLPQNSGTNTVLFRFIRHFGTAGSPSTDDSFDPISRLTLTNNVWNFVTWTYTMPTLTSKTLGNTQRDNGYEFVIYPNDGTTNAINLALCSLQLELGQTYTGYHKRTFEEELFLCKPFYQKSFNIEQVASHNIISGRHLFSHSPNSGSGTGTGYHSLPFEREMWKTPLIVFWGPQPGTTAQVWNFATGTTSSATAIDGSQNTKTLNFQYAPPTSTLIGHLMGIQWEARADWADNNGATP